MAKKTELQKNIVSEIKPGVDPINKNEDKNAMPEKVTEKKKKKTSKKSSALLAASLGRSAVGAVKAHSSKDVRGSSGLANTGTIISYD